MSSALTPHERWATEEEERVRQNPAPPLWDEGENVEPRFIGKSGVFQKELDFIQKAVVIERNDVNFIYSAPGFPYVLSAVLTGDLPFMRALGRFNANFNITVEPRKLTPINALVFMLRQMSVFPASMIPQAHCGGTPDIEVVEWLLNRGVDPTIVDIDGKSPLQNALCKETFHDIPPIMAQSPSLHEYYSKNKTQLMNMKNLPIDLALCKLLLLHGANPRDIDYCNDSGMKDTLKAYVRELREKNVPRPPQLCPCGKNVPLSECHGSKRGVPVHPRMLCLCRSGKIYKKCCLKRRYYYRESLTETIPPPMIMDTKSCPSTTELFMKHMERERKKMIAQGLTEEEIGNTKIFPGGAEGYRESQKKMISDLLDLPFVVGDPRVCKCLRWVVANPDPRNDFMWARPWRKNGHCQISKTECKIRQKEWNGWVDAYIAIKDTFSDPRSALEIEKLMKVSWSGAALWKWCSYPECGRKEESLDTFKFCSKCQIVAYCSKDCQASHWKDHKKECGKYHTEHMLPFQIAMDTLFSTCTEIIETMSNKELTEMTNIFDAI